MFRLIATPFAAVLRILRSFAQLHPAVYSVTPAQEHPTYQHTF